MLKFNSKPVAEHSEVPLADGGELEALVEQWSARETREVVTDDRSACYVASVGAERDPVARAAQLAEIVALVRHQGGRIVGQELCHLTKPHARTLLGTGTAQAIAERARASGATMLVLEMVPAALSTEITTALPTCHTIGIGAGKGTAGQVLVMHDMLGINLGKNPKFVRNFMDGAASVRDAMAAYVAAVKDGSFPDDQLHAW